MSTKDHIVVLKKIPVDPRHVGALRLHRETSALHAMHREHMHSSGSGSAGEALYRMFSFFLLWAFLINPIGVAYAAEVTEIPDAPVEESAPVEEETPPLVPGVTIVVPPSEEGGQSPPISDQPGEVLEEASAEEPSLDANTPTEEATTTSATSTEEVFPMEGDGATSTDETATTTDGVATSTDESIPSIEEEEEMLTATSTENTASSTEEVVVPVVIEEPPATNLSREQTPEERAAEREVAAVAMREQLKKEVEAEMRSRCVSYGDDGYYCLDESSAEKVTSEAPVEQVVSSREGGGDKEIVLIRALPEGESRTPITVNDVDDEFPSADSEMRMIVWQTLVSGRWQIAYKEGVGGEIAYLTANQDGNGHPATDGKRIAWQGWSGDNWDIFIAEPGSASPWFATATSGPLLGIHPGWTVTRLSDSTAHDMFPKIAGNFVTWQERRSDHWVVRVHDLSTGHTRTIEGEAGGTGETPTVALIFKERTKEGRIFIRASDLSTGERIPLRDDEIPLPTKLPIPEQSGALPIQSGTSSVTSIRAEGDGDGGTPDI